MRNNSDRLGLEPETPQDDTDPVQQITQNNNISFPTPTELVPLPSKGQFYTKEHPLYHVEHIEIREMTLGDEEILNSRTLLSKGIALDKMLQGLIVKPKVKIDDLYLCDKNALILAARSMNYDPEYTTQVVCPTCMEKFQHTFNLNLVQPKESAEDVIISSEGTFELTLPRSKSKVVVKMLTGQDEKALKFQEEKRQKHKLPLKPISDQLKQIIVSIDGNDNAEVIGKFLEKTMVARDAKFIRSEYARIVPNLDLRQDVECSKCFTSSTIDIPFTADFFWPK